jgi:hypothetical protein
MTSTFEKILSKYLPEQSIAICAVLISHYNIHLQITRSRSTKFGDYRPLQKKSGHKITINHDLNPYAFLITFIHEVAHLICEEKYRYRISPHGAEWKSEFRHLLRLFIQKGIFPPDLKTSLQSYLHNPAASSCSDEGLYRVLKKYDQNRHPHVAHLEELPHGTLFKLNASRSGLIFQKGHKQRTRFHCTEIGSKKEYLVNQLAEVVVYRAQ